MGTEEIKMLIRDGGVFVEERIFIALGSNLEPENNIRRGLELLAKKLVIKAISPFYRSQALGRKGDPDFLNGVIEVGTRLKPLALKYEILRPCEEGLGRIRSEDKNAPRTLDLDLILYGRRVSTVEGLELPDKGLRYYPFVAIPLLDLWPEAVLPDDGTRLKDIFPGSFEEYGLSLVEGYP